MFEYGESVTCKRDGFSAQSPGHAYSLTECNKHMARDNRSCGAPEDHHTFDPDPASHPYDSDGDGSTPCKECNLLLPEHTTVVIAWVERQEWDGPVR